MDFVAAAVAVVVVAADVYHSAILGELPVIHGSQLMKTILK